MSLFKNEEEKRKLIEFKDTDDDLMRTLKSELQLVMGMSLEERKVFYQEQRINEAEHQLQYMIEQNQQCDGVAYDYTRRAKEYVELYEESREETYLERAESCADIAKGYKEAKFSIGDIREQREKIQWERRKLRQMTSTSTELGQSSNPSKT